MNGFWIPRDKKLTAADFKRLASQSVGYDRDNVPDRVAAILYEIEKKKMLLVKVTDPAMREELWKAIVRHYEDMNEVQALHRDDLSQQQQSLFTAFTLWTQRQMHDIKIYEFTDAEARLATYLMQQDERGRPLSFRDIAEAEGCSHMAIKRRVDSLRRRHKAFSNCLERNIPRKPGRVALQKPTKAKKE